MGKLVILVSLFFIFIATGCDHQEGTVKIDDCREVIYLKSDSWRLQFQKFVCTYDRDSSGKIIGGTCVHVDLENGLFTKTGMCKTAYVYSFYNAPPAEPAPAPAPPVPAPAPPAMAPEQAPSSPPSGKSDDNS